MSFQGTGGVEDYFHKRSSVYTRAPHHEGASGVNLQAMELYHAGLPVLRGLDLFVGSGEPVRVPRLWIHTTQSPVKKMSSSGKSTSSGLNLTETVRKFCQFLTTKG